MYYNDLPFERGLKQQVSEQFFKFKIPLSTSFDVFQTQSQRRLTYRRLRAFSEA